MESGVSKTRRPTACKVVAVGRRRDGGTRYWCVAHRADATAKYGKRARACRAAHLPPEAGKSIDIDATKYDGGIALWGAVPPVYDTTRLPLDRGIHVHARRRRGGHKEIDSTYAVVRLRADVGASYQPLSSIDAIYYMVSTVFGFGMRQVLCSHCGEAHLDKDWFSVHPHARHLCAACGRTFSDSERGIGNPIVGVRSEIGAKRQKVKSAGRALAIRQEDYPGGIQIWGSNPALLWTGSAAEEEGIHLHAFKKPGYHPDIDDTYSDLRIDGIRLSASLVRTLMAQNAMPHLEGRVASLTCTKCGFGIRSVGTSRYTPAGEHQCNSCGKRSKSRGKKRKTIANPLIEILKDLARRAPRPPQANHIGLLPEAP